MHIWYSKINSVNIEVDTLLCETFVYIKDKPVSIVCGQDHGWSCNRKIELMAQYMSSKIQYSVYAKNFYHKASFI